MRVSKATEMCSTALLQPHSFSLPIALLLLSVVALADASQTNARFHLRSRQQSQSPKATADRASSSRVLVAALTPDQPQAQLQSPFQSSQEQNLNSDSQDSSLQQLSPDPNADSSDGPVSFARLVENTGATDPLQQLLLQRSRTMAQQRQQRRRSLAGPGARAGAGAGSVRGRVKKQRPAWLDRGQLPIRESSESFAVNEWRVPSLENLDPALDPLPDQRAPETLMPLLGVPSLSLSHSCYLIYLVIVAHAVLMFMSTWKR